MERPRTLSILFDHFAANQRLRSLLVDAFAGCPLRPDEYAVYSCLIDYGPRSITEVAEICGLPTTTVATYVRDMVERGHVSRSANPKDGRSSLIELGADGLAAHRLANEAFRRAEDRLLARLSMSPESIRTALQDLELAARDARADLQADAHLKTG